MGETGSGPPIVGFPERLDRRMRLGPFASARDAVKFVTYAALGALLSLFTSPWACVPVVGAGFILSVWRPDGQALDERIAAFVSWRIRANSAARAPTPVTNPPLVRQGLLQLSPHHYVAIVRTGGSPMAYLPPDELARRFELYRELLRSIEGSFAFLTATVPIRAQSIRPATTSGGAEDSLAFSGYSELVAVLSRRRYLRRVYVVIGAVGPGPDVPGRLEGRASALVEALGHLGLRPTRLRDRALSEAARRFGWPVRVAP
jgi:hypothetical protein